MQTHERNHPADAQRTHPATEPLVARFANVHLARAGAEDLAAEGLTASRKPVVSLPGYNRRFQWERGLWALLGASLGANVGALTAGLGLGLGTETIARQAAPSLWPAMLIGALLMGTLGLIAGFALGEPRATRATTRALRAGESEGEVAVRFDEVPASRRQAVVDELRRLGALQVESASHAAPQA